MLLRQTSLPQPVQYEPDAVPLVTVSAEAEGRPHEVLVLPVFEAPAAPAGSAPAHHGHEEGAQAHTLLTAHPGLAELDQAALGGLALALTTHSFTGKKGQVLPPVMLHKPVGTRSQQLLLIGLGKEPQGQEWGPTAFHAAGAALASAAKSYRLQAAVVRFGPELAPPQPADSSQEQHTHTPAPGAAAAAAAAPAAATSFVAAALSALYEGNVRYRSKPESKVVLQSIQLLVPAGAEPAWAAAAARGVALARGNLMARYLVESPANVCTPSHLAAAAQHIAALNPDRFSLKVLDEAGCRELGMGLFVGVGQGSEEPLRLIHLTYTPPGDVRRKVAFVGKGVTFDSGGYNLKVQGGIETMKCDMGGAGAVLGAARAIAELQPQGAEVHFISAACENMVSGRATHPSDIHTAANGTTVEVNDTDAEGRLTLADAVWYAQAKAGAQVVVDIATLTGAAGVALGQDTAALFANTDTLAAAVDAASRAAGEKLWRLPLNQDLRAKLDSPIADLKNYAGRFGGAITAALFLQEFIVKGTDWCHLDIAGPAWDDVASLPTGFGAATLALLAEALAA